MDPVAFQTYTHFFTHTGHICYFLQNELWQERTENTIGRLSDASSEAVEKLEHSLEYHRQMDKKQNMALRNQEVILDQDQKIAKSLEQTRSEMGEAFDEMSEMAEKQKRLLSEMFSSLQNSVDVVRNLMSLLVVEFVGYETFATFLVAWLVIVFLPHFGYSKLKLHVVLFTDLFLEILVRRIYSFWVFRDGTQAPPDNLVHMYVHVQLYPITIATGFPALTLQTPVTDRRSLGVNGDRQDGIQVSYTLVCTIYSRLRCFVDYANQRKL